MHRLILSAPKNLEVDHKNGNTLDNRRSNLRLCTRSQNAANIPTNRAKSGLRGVYFSKQKNKWKATITEGGREKHLGYFLDKESAARAYDKAAEESFGDFARLNGL